MKTSNFLKIVLRIILLFLFPILISLIIPYIHNILGDRYVGLNDRSEFCRDGWDWSGTHYWLAVMCWCLFVASIINFIVWMHKIVND